MDAKQDRERRIVLKQREMGIELGGAQNRPHKRFTYKGWQVGIYEWDDNDYMGVGYVAGKNGKIMQKGSSNWDEDKAEAEAKKVIDSVADKK